MKLRDRVKDAWNALTATASGAHPYATGFFPSWPDQNPFVPLSGPGDLTLSSVVMACVNWAGTTYPSAPVVVQEQKGLKVWETIPDHPLVELLEDPNPYFAGVTYWRSFAYWWLVYGNVYYYKARNPRGQVVELWQLDSRAVMPMWLGGPGADLPINALDASSERSGITYRYSGAGLPPDIPPSDIIHFRSGIDPNNHLLGLPPVRAILREVATDNEISTYSTQIMANFGIPSFVVAPKPTPDGVYRLDEQGMDEDIRARTMGAMRGKPLIFSKPMDLTAFGFSPDQMGVEKLSRRPETRVCAVLGIPAIVVGFEVGLERSIYSNIRAAEELAWVNHVIPTQDYIARTLTDDLLSEPILSESGEWAGSEADETYRVIFDRSAVAALQEDRNELYTRESMAWTSGWKKLNEVRSAAGLENDPNGDVYISQASGGITQQTDRPVAIGTPAQPRAKQFGDPASLELAELDRWYAAVAPRGAQGLLDAVSKPAS
jgi:HK97 family phage portal protein